MSKWIPAIIIFVWSLVATVLWGQSYTKVGQLEKDKIELSKQVRAEKAKTQAIVEEYNALKQLQDDGDRKKQASKEKTDAAKASHVKSGVPVYASKHDAGLLRQRSLEVRGEATGDTSKPN